MVSTQRALLRLHIEAVWGVQLPPLVQNNIELSSAGFQPPWKLCVAQMADEQIAIWRSDVPATEREELLTHVSEALKLPPTTPVAPEIRREVALQQAALPTVSIDIAQKFACPLTPDDQALVETFYPGYVDFYYHPNKRPLIGVIVDGRLLSFARSSRRTAEACELGIDTLPEARRRGYALAATVLWTATVAQEGLVPLYSASADNTASLALAAATGYRVFARVASIQGQ
jgi:hypothetical protein